MNTQKSQKASKTLLKIIGIAGTGAFLSCLLPAVFSQSAFSQNAPADQTTGGAREDEAGGFANPSTRTDDPSRSVPGSTPSMQNNMPQMNDSTRMNSSTNQSSMENYSSNMSARERNSVTISQWPKNRIERYTFPNSTNTEMRFDGTNYLSVTPGGSASQNAGMAGNMNMMGTGSGAGGVSGQMNQMNQSGSYSAPNQGNTVAPGNTTAPSSGRINDQLTAPNNNMPGRSTYDSPNTRSQPMNESSGMGGGTGGQNSFGQANDRVNNPAYNSDGSTVQMNQRNQMNTPGAGVGGGTGGGRADEFGGQTQQRIRVDDPSVSAPEVQNNSGQSNTQMNNTDTQRNNGGSMNNNTTSPGMGTGSGTGGAVPGLW